MTRHADEAYQIVNSTAFPGWGYMVERGATTLWETWKESDNTYSNCHPMFGSVSEWFYRWLAGIRPVAEHPGFKKFLLTPSFPEGLNEVSAIYHAPSGDIKIAWKRDLTRKLSISISVPHGISANFSPTGKARHSWKVTNVTTQSTIVKEIDDQDVILKEGVYKITEI